ncbi:MAG: adenosine kinase, partial [Candidatus Eremiobacteraeota bacterium]|nr:adenosine kinase [Candidatus Eremiobacteraeota bacterium]
AAEIAHGAGKKVSLSLSDAFCVIRHRSAFQRLVDCHVDILFGNDGEFAALLETNTLDEAVRDIRRLTDLAIITRGPEGSIIVTPDDAIEISAVPVKRVVDTTGAGDLYAAGFLHAYTQGKSLIECGELGSALAAKIICHVGARPQTPF